jgi:hypothetical protein
VMPRIYLDDQARSSISASRHLSELQLNTVLWRARQR